MGEEVENDEETWGRGEEEPGEGGKDDVKEAKGAARNEDNGEANEIRACKSGESISPAFDGLEAGEDTASSGRGHRLRQSHEPRHVPRLITPRSHVVT